MERNRPTISSFILVGLASLYYLYMFFIRVLPTVMTNDLMSSFQANGVQIGILMVSFVYAYAVSQIPAGILIDRYGTKRILTFGMLGCFLSGYLFQTTNSFWVAVLARILQGLFSGPSFIAPMAMVKQNLPEKLYTPAAGFIQVLGCIGAMLIKPASNLVTEVGWREAISYTVILGAILFLIYCLYPNNTDQNNPQRHSTALALSEILTQRSFWIVAFLALSSWAAVGGFTEGWGVYYLSILQDISICQASSQMSWAWVGVAISSPLAGFWFENSDNKVIPLMTLYTFGILSMFLLVSGHITHPYIISVLLLLLGASAGAQPIAFKLITKISPDHVQATAVSFCNMCVIGGAFIVQPIVSQVLELAWDGKTINQIPYYQPEHFQIAFIPIIIILCIAVLISRTIEQFWA